ncbi:DUF4268 domain-containing protein [Flavobacterium kingsejongi]|uniref:DUF4268 domain-containing protein n=1 Tax=Flavobacterium kingsejongi TaxID=1678728 RepID=A0A2S1LPA0_9FLAO|nr:DUF4268 domain-containing protein [Flavobacterium kingsejongi]AWG25564.1 hypothetical protein FK004_10140 [Flavobacterium kingsejongi]
MYSKAEAQKLKRVFWISFANTYPRKWMLYDTKIKDFSFKFYADSKKAQVIIDIENKELEKRMAYYEKMVSLKSILEDEFIKDLVFEQDHILETGKVISRIWVEKPGISLNNPTNWDQIFEFFNTNMAALENFYAEYDEYIKEIAV